MYARDDLDRLIDFKRARLNEGRTDIPTAGGDRVRREEWTLSDTGNWSEYKVDQNGDEVYTGSADLDQDRTHNVANEIYNSTAGAAITEGQGQTAWADPDHDAAGNPPSPRGYVAAGMTGVPKPSDMTAFRGHDAKPQRVGASHPPADTRRGQSAARDGRLWTIARRAVSMAAEECLLP